MKKLTVLILTVLILFSCNKKDDPTPTQTTPPTGTTTPPITTTNTPPTVSANPSSASNPTTITINATDSDGTISKVEVFNGSTLLTTLTTSPYIYTLPTLTNGSYTYTVKATDNSNAVSSTTVSFTVSTTTTPKTDTETILNGFTNKSLSKVGGSGQFIGTLTITSTTMSASQTQAVGELFGGASASGTYTVNSSGYLILTSGAIQTTYSVSSGTKSGNPTLILTNVNDATKIYVFQSNSTPQEITVATLSSFSGRGLQGLYGSTTINSTSFITTATQPSGKFFVGVASAGTYNYTVLSNGNIQFVAGAYTIEYSVQLASGTLVLTNVNDGSQIYTLY